MIGFSTKEIVKNSAENPRPIGTTTMKAHAIRLAIDQVNRDLNQQLGKGNQRGYFIVVTECHKSILRPKRLRLPTKAIALSATRRHGKEPIAIHLKKRCNKSRQSIVTTVTPLLGGPSSHHRYRHRIVTGIITPLAQRHEKAPIAARAIGASYDNRWYAPLISEAQTLF